MKPSSFASVKLGVVAVKVLGRPEYEQFMKFTNNIEAGKFLIRLGYRFQMVLDGEFHFSKHNYA